MGWGFGGIQRGYTLTPSQNAAADAGGIIALYATVTLAEAATCVDGALSFCLETATFYRDMSNGAAYTVNHNSVLATSDAGDTRRIGVGGRYVYGKSVSDTSLGVGLGSVDPATKCHIADSATASPRGFMSSQHNTGTDGARLHMRKSRGTLTAPTTVVTEDTLGKLVASGYDGSNYLEMGSISVAVEGTVAATRVPTKLVFSTATDAAPSVLTERMRITSAGKIGVAGATNPTAMFELSGGVAATDRIALYGVDEGYTACVASVNRYGGLSLKGRTDLALGSLFSAMATSGDSYGRIAFGFDTGVPFLGFGPGSAGRDVFLKRSSGHLSFQFGTSPTEKAQITSTGGMSLVGGIACHGKSIPSQAAHIADPSGGGTQDAEARAAIAAINVVLEARGFVAES